MPNPSTTPEPSPAPHAGLMADSAHWQVMQDLAARAQMGLQQYGTILTDNNGRNHLVDAYQEMLDFLVYMRLAINAHMPISQEERQGIIDPIGNSEAMATHLRTLGWQCFEPGKVSMAYEEMVTILRTGGYIVAEDMRDLREQMIQRRHVVWEIIDRTPVLTLPELEAEAERQGYVLLSKASMGDTVAATDTPNPSPPSLDDMETILSAAGYLVRKDRMDEATWRRIGEKEGYSLISSASSEEPQRNSPAPGVETADRQGAERYALTIMGAARHHWAATHEGQTWDEATARELIMLLTGKSWPCALPYDEHKTELARDPDLARWFPAVEE